jgi:histidine triad (HIT) family protein
MDIAPVTPGHLLVVPLEHATHLADLEPEIGRVLFARAAGQEIFHVHLHVIPRVHGDGFGLRLPAGYGPHADRAGLDRDAAAIARALHTPQHSRPTPDGGTEPPQRNP